MNFLSFDIEIYNELYTPEGVEIGLDKVIPSVAAFCLDNLNVEYFDDAPGPMSKETAKRLVYEMYSKYEQGIIPLTHNGLSFDFQLLALYSGMIKECSIMALNHFDTMFMITCYKGYFLGLDTLLTGMGVESKIHSVTLNDGSVINDMSGKIAPEMWRKGECNAVKTYLAGDVIQPMKLVKQIESTGGMHWFSKSGKPQSLRTKLLTVKECFSLPFVDTSWMSNPPQRADFVDWIPEEIYYPIIGEIPGRG